MCRWELDTSDLMTDHCCAAEAVFLFETPSLSFHSPSIDLRAGISLIYVTSNIVVQPVMLLQGISTLLGLRFDLIWFGITPLKANVFSDRHNIAGRGNFTTGKEHAGSSELVAACDWTPGLIEYNATHSESWQILGLGLWSPSMTKETATFHNNPVVQKAMCDALVNKLYSTTTNRCGSVWCQRQMASKLHKGRRLLSHQSFLMHPVHPIWENFWISGVISPEPRSKNKQLVSGKIFLGTNLHY